MQWQGCGQRCRQGVSQGEGWVEGYCPLQRAWTLRLDGVPMLLGFWWIMVSGQLKNLYFSWKINAYLQSGGQK